MLNDPYIGGRFGMRGVVFDPITMTVATVAGAAVSAAGTLMGGNAAGQAGQMAAKADLQQAADQGSALDFKAAQEDQAAQQTRASTQRDALEKQREAKLALSTLQARSAASGGGASDPTIAALAGRIGGRGEYESLSLLASGENQARGIEDQAMGDRMTKASVLAGGSSAAAADMTAGNAKKSASYLSAAGTLIGSAGSAYRNYKGYG